MFFEANSTQLVIASSFDGNPDYREFGTLPELQINVWTKVQISQLLQSNGDYIFEINIGGEQICQLVNTDAREFNDVKIFVGDPYRSPSNALIDHLEIETFGEFIFGRGIIFNTKCFSIICLNYQH